MKQQHLLTLGIVAVLLLSSCKNAFIEPDDSSNTSQSENLRVYYTKIDYNTANADIWSAKPDGSDKKKIIAHAILFSQPRQGKMCYTVSENGFGSGSIYVANTDGSNPVRIASGASLGVLSPDASKIAFTKNTNGSLTQVFTANSDGSNMVEVMSHAAWETIPSWSPDSKKLAVFGEDLYPDETSSGLYIMNADGSSSQMIANYTVVNSENDLYENLEWSPDGSQITTGWVDRENSPSVYYVAVVAANGSGVRHLPLLTSDGSYPGSWLNGSNNMVLTRSFRKDESSKEWDGFYLSVCNAQGANMHDVSSKLDGETLFPRFSPDNSQILYFHINGGYDVDKNRDRHRIEIQNADGNSRSVLEEGNIYFRAFWVR